jgi:DNA repair protein RadC
LVYPRIFFGPVIGQSAYAFVHNHPSDDPAPSEADVRLTRRLAEGVRILQINMVDHVIVGQLYAVAKLLARFSRHQSQPTPSGFSVLGVREPQGNH